MPPILKGLLQSVLSVLEDANIVADDVPEDDLERVGATMGADLAIVSVAAGTNPPGWNRLWKDGSLLKLLVLADEGKWMSLHVPLGELSPAELRDAIRRLRDRVPV